MKIIKIILNALLIIFVLIQFLPNPTKNNLSQPSITSIENAHQVPDSVLNILKTSCYDCHSNQTFYPWYARIKPISWWLNNHINEGKEELNFSIFGSYSIGRQYHKLKEIKEQVEENEMPLKSYTLIHRNAVLEREKKSILVSWINQLQDSFQKNYPIDSLKRKKRIH